MSKRGFCLTKKSGTCATWMVGYTPQLSAAVWVGSEDNTALKDGVPRAREVSVWPR
jgi:membrane peptidoglycan carboxypeptidase